MREQLVERSCAWCGEPVAYSGRGRPPRFCSPVHRRRAWEVRSAEERASRPVSEGGRSTDPVREIVQRTETVVRTRVLPDAGRMPQAPKPAQRLSGQPYTLPEDAIEWIEALAALRRDALTNPRVAPFREHVANACERTLEVLRSDAPGPGEASPGES
ncbi:hypothetical protein OHB33_41160 (plasmid) [Streptomyces sp. NBC_01558]|uniref:hypothetical protein n=1 Tax=Streptomyces sp. NBC_01558 TaxID=2975878 RepID=UPI002DD85E2E|nr:hypothetical protein [Streptomyces sp. NBC_01558]WSD82796.1 hypothetical protein OHB33_41160 [Streptomyces sp. NBC_01558]